MKTFFWVSRITMALLFVGLAGFCAFGFMAAHELSSAAARWPWQLTYAVLALISLVTAARLLLAKRPKD